MILNRDVHGHPASSPWAKPEKQKRSDSLRTKVAAHIQKDVSVLTRADSAHPVTEAEKCGAQHQRDARPQHSTFVALPARVLSQHQRS